MLYHQKIYDSTAGWCFYSLSTITPTPLVGDTTPNHTNNLVAASHAVLAREPEPATGGDPRELLWEWNEVDLSQLTLAGATGNWNVTYSATGGPAGVPCIVFTTLTNNGGAGAGDLFVRPTVQPTLGSYYAVEMGLGPYTGKTTAKVGYSSIFAYIDTNNWYGYQPQGDNVLGAGAQSLQAIQRNGGGYSFANLGVCWPDAPTAKGQLRVRVQVTGANSLSAGVEAFGLKSRLDYGPGPSTATLGVGLRVAHFANAPAIGDSTYVYGWRVFGKNAF